ncbi:hypothetical protein [Nostoc sp.]|uniref:hypothetical protein n=1 Tax=Nostoc sp. TaxID=1180 RepID=UPI002FF6AFFC
MNILLIAARTHPQQKSFSCFTTSSKFEFTEAVAGYLRWHNRPPPGDRFDPKSLKIRIMQAAHCALVVALKYAPEF